MGRLVIMGEITVKDLDDSERDHHMALLIEFDSAEDIRKAIADGHCTFKFGD